MFNLESNIYLVLPFLFLSVSFPTVSVWSPPPQPYSPETYSPCPTDPSSPPETAFMVENVQSNFPISSCQSDIPTSVMTSFTTTHPMHPQPYLPTMAPSYPSCGSLSPYPDPYQQAPPMPYQRVDVPTSGDLDAIDIIAHSNPIQYYPDYSQPTQMPHLFTNDHLVSMYSHSLPAPSSSGRSQKSENSHVCTFLVCLSPNGRLSIGSHEQVFHHCLCLLVL